MERGTRIRSAATGGDVIATRTATQTTSTGDARVIQLVDLAPRQLADWSRVIRTVSAADGVDLSTVLTAPFVAAALRIGDCGHVVVSPRFTASAGAATITPLVLHDDGQGVVTCVGLLAAKSASAGTLQQSPHWLAPLLVWETQGASMLGLHVTAFTGGGELSLVGGALAERSA